MFGHVFVFCHVFGVRSLCKFSVRVRSCSIIYELSEFVFVRVQYFLKNPCSCSFMFGRTRTNTSVRSIRVRVLSSLVVKIVSRLNKFQV